MNIKKITEFINIENNKFIFVIILVGVCFMLFAGGEKGDTKNKAATDEQIILNDEERLCDILSEIKGVGSVSVMITYDATVQSDIAYELKQEKTVKGDGGDVTNEQSYIDKQAVMSSGEPFVTRSVYPEVRGVVIAAKGAVNPEVRENIIEAASTVLGIARHKVCVAEKN